MKFIIKNRLTHYGIGGKILTLCLCFCIILPLCVGGIAYFVALDAMNQETRLSLISQVSSTRFLTEKTDILSLDKREKEQMQKMLSDYIRNTSVGKTGYMYVIDSKGTILVHPKLEGQNLAQYDFVQEIIKTKNGYIRYPWEGRDKVVAYAYYEPLDWIIASGSYIEEFEGPLESIKNAIIITIILSSLIGGCIAYLLARSITIPLKRVVSMISELSNGHMGIRLSMRRRDEIGTMANAMDSFVDFLQLSVIKSIQKIANGEKAEPIPIKDPGDEITPAINRMIQTLNALLDQMGILIGEAREGRLQARGDVSSFVGIYHELVVGINLMLDAITIPLDESLRVAEQYANVDFDARFDESVSVKGDLLELKIKLNQIGEHVGTELKSVIQEISDQVKSLSESAESSAATVQQLTAGADTIAQSVENVQKNADFTKQSVQQVATAMEDLSRSVSTVASKVDLISRFSQDADSTSTQGVSKAIVAEEGITAINGAVNDVGEMIHEIREQMTEIGKIVDIISTIADQTNLLALNAAIEAARAGDAGLGFTVVANEVKTLAQDSQVSAENIAHIISSLQQKSEKAAHAMNLATEEVTKGSAAINDTMSFFKTIADQTRQITSNITEVAGLSEEEAATVEEITANVSEVSKIASSTAEEAIGAAAASEEAAAVLKQFSEMQVILAEAAVNIKNSMIRLTG